MGADRARVLALAGLTAGVVVVADQAVKALVRREVGLGDRSDLVGGALRLVHVENDGVAFGQLSGNATLIGAVVALALGALLWFFLANLDTPLVWLPTGMLLGGALGNVVDRLRAGVVTDYLKLPSWPAFNLADLCITFGVIGLLVVVERDARRRSRAAREAEAAPAPEEAGGGAAGPA